MTRVSRHKGAGPVLRDSKRVSAARTSRTGRLTAGSQPDSLCRWDTPAEAGSAEEAWAGAGRGRGGGGLS